jgi:hypothetical protein
MIVAPSRRVVRLVLIAIALRGVGYALLTPTYEGWDEYQHLGYFETNSLKLGVAVMPVSVMNDVANLPVPKALKDQAPASSLQTYAEYWSGPEPGVDSAVPLYEVQHAPWYYVVHAPIHALFADDCFRTVRALRVVNVLWVIVGLSLVAVGFRNATVNRRTADSTLVLLAVQPLFLMTFVRVANDAMAFAFACAAAATLVNVGSAASDVRAGVFLGLAGAVKATAWTLFPAAFLLSLLPPNRLGRSVRFTAAFALIATSSMAFDAWRHGRFAPTQEASVLAEHGKGPGDVIAAAATIDWVDEFERRWGRQLLWVGGWSFAPLPKILPRLHQWLLVASLIPLTLRFWRGGQKDRGFAVFCTVACLGVAAGQAIHMAQSKAALGFVATPAWYAVIVLPWAFAGLVWSWGFDERLRRVALSAFFALLLCSELVGVFFVWLPTFAASNSLVTVVQRCSVLAGGDGFFASGVLGFIGGWVAAVCGLVALFRREKV